MWIVKFDDNTRHSAWSSKDEALHQAAVMEKYGLISPDHHGGDGLLAFVENDDTVECKNGHYYV